MTIDEKAKSLAAADWVIIAGYFILCVTIGLWVSKFNTTEIPKARFEYKLSL